VKKDEKPLTAKDAKVAQSTQEERPSAIIDFLCDLCEASATFAVKSFGVAVKRFGEAGRVATICV
jgi:hypothetical protein